VSFGLATKRYAEKCELQSSASSGLYVRPRQRLLPYRPLRVGYMFWRSAQSAWTMWKRPSGMSNGFEGRVLGASTPAG